MKINEQPSSMEGAGENINPVEYERTTLMKRMSRGPGGKAIRAFMLMTAVTTGMGMATDVEAAPRNKNSDIDHIDTQKRVAKNILHSVLSLKYPRMDTQMFKNAAPEVLKSSVQTHIYELALYLKTGGKTEKAITDQTDYLNALHILTMEAHNLPTQDQANPYIRTLFGLADRYNVGNPDGNRSGADISGSGQNTQPGNSGQARVSPEFNDVF